MTVVHGVGLNAYWTNLIEIVTWVTMAVLPFIALIVVLYIYASEKAHRMKQVGHCDNCGYNLFGINEARCPECGRLTHDEGKPYQLAPDDSSNAPGASLGEVEKKGPTPED